ncbi:MAG: radical SAM protein, partial [Pseudomonadota bacterium]
MNPGQVSMVHPDLLTAPAPKTLWIELTSKCPFDCIFCSRKLLRGNGEHMEFELFERILAQLDAPDILRLNYSGESVHYPHLGAAIRAAKATGATVELVSAFSSASDAAIRGMVDGGLDRLGVSVHTADQGQYRRIYRYASLDLLKDRLRFLRAYQQRKRRLSPELGFAFVAMEENLGELRRVVELAREVGVAEVSIHPVIRRDPILVQFPAELDGSGDLRPEFAKRLLETVEKARAGSPGVAISVARPNLAPTPPSGASDAPRDGISTCEQNPWETAHILANGDVVVCEVQD